MVETTSLNERAYARLLSDILTGALAPGDPVDRRAVAERLGISLAPVHMAVNQLEAEGFVRSRPRCGTHVRVYRASEINGLMIVREAIECQAARMYAGERVAARRCALLPLARRAQDGALALPDRVRADIAFHRELVSLAGVDMLTLEFDRAMRVGLFLAAAEMLPGWRVPLDDHGQLLNDLCAAAGPREAEDRIRRHIQRQGRPESSA